MRKKDPELAKETLGALRYPVCNQSGLKSAFRGKTPGFTSFRTASFGAFGTKKRHLPRSEKGQSMLHLRKMRGPPQKLCHIQLASKQKSDVDSLWTSSVPAIERSCTFGPCLGHMSVQGAEWVGCFQTNDRHDCRGKLLVFSLRTLC